MAHENHGVPSLRGEVENLFRQALGPSSPLGGGCGPWLPTLDLLEEADRFVIEMDVPGVRLEDLSISVAGRRLTVRGGREIVRERSGPRVHVMERCSGSFSRSLELPDQIDEGRIAATVLEGILRIELPRRGGRR